MAVEPPRPGPAFRRAQHDHGPANPRRSAAAARAGLDRPDFRHALAQRACHLPVHGGRIVASHETGAIAMPLEEGLQFRGRDARQQGRVGDLVAVQVQDGQHGAVARRVQEPGRLPGGGQRAGFGLAVPDHRGDDQVGIVEGRPKRVRQAVAQLTALVDRAGQLWRAVRTDAVRRRKVPEQVRHAGLVLRAFGIALRVVPVEIGMGQHPPRRRVLGRTRTSGPGRARG